MTSQSKRNRKKGTAVAAAVSTVAAAAAVTSVCQSCFAPSEGRKNHFCSSNCQSCSEGQKSESCYKLYARNILNHIQSFEIPIKTLFTYIVAVELCTAPRELCASGPRAESHDL